MLNYQREVKQDYIVKKTWGFRKVVQLTDLVQDPNVVVSSNNINSKNEGY